MSDKTEDQSSATPSSQSGGDSDQPKNEADSSQSKPPAPPPTEAVPQRPQVMRRAIVRPAAPIVVPLSSLTVNESADDKEKEEEEEEEEEDEDADEVREEELLPPPVPEPARDVLPAPKSSPPPLPPPPALPAEAQIPQPLADGTMRELQRFLEVTGLPFTLDDFDQERVKFLLKELNRRAREINGHTESRLQVSREMLKTQLVQTEETDKIRVVIQFFVYRAFNHEDLNETVSADKSVQWMKQTLAELTAPPAEKELAVAETIQASTPHPSAPPSSGMPSSSGRPTESRSATPADAHQQMGAAAAAWNRDADSSTTVASAATAPDDEEYEDEPPLPRLPNPAKQIRTLRQRNRLLFWIAIASLLAPLTVLAIFVHIYSLAKQTADKLEKVNDTTTQVAAPQPTCQSMSAALLKQHLGQSDPAKFEERSGLETSKPYVDCEGKKVRSLGKNKSGHNVYDVRGCNICWFK